MSDIRRRRPELLEMVGLRRWGRTLVRKYSKGMMQRLGLAQAMLHDPELLILDEPTDGVDPVGRAKSATSWAASKARGKRSSSTVTCCRKSSWFATGSLFWARGNCGGWIRSRRSAASLRRRPC